MEYTVQKLALLAGVTARTLRYYDRIGLLKPARLSSSGYRIYGEPEVTRLQQILFFRELDVRLEEIGRILDSPGFSASGALRRHHELLLERRARLDRLIANVEKTIASEKGEILMTDQEKFEGFMQSRMEENERNYGGEIRQKYGRKAVEGSYRKLKDMTPEAYGQFQALEQELNETMLRAFAAGDPAGESARKTAELHRQWLSYFWSGYSPEAHAALARMYTDDPRFTAYYDRLRPGLAVFLRDAILHYTGQMKKS